ncbi:MAG TPA: cell division protein FtsA [Rubrobacteraceae bacterium]|nr:cell division protein FtsA [Rubrobacteraceae bacterium]
MAQSLVYGIDVGTTKIVALAGRVDTRRGWVEVLSMGEAPSHGLKRGVVVDRRAAGESVAAAIEACGVRGGPVSVGIAGSHISSFNTEVTVLNRSKSLTITDRFVRKLEAEARELDLHEDEQVMHVIPRGYVLDGSEGVKNPVGLAARKVTMRAHVVSGAVSSIQNLLHVVEDCGVNVSRVVLEPLASAEACLLDSDRDNGVVLIDVGGGTTDIAVFLKGALTHTAVIPIGGESFSADLAYGLKIPQHKAEKLKRRYGTVLSYAVDPVAAVKLDDRYYNANFMSQILEYRAREVFEYVRNSLESVHVHNLLPGGAILTGGGSLLDGMTELAEDILGMRARTATPRRVRGEIKPVQKPQYATSVGLLYFSARHGEPGPKVKGAGATSFGSIVEAVRSWFRGG